MCLLLTGLIASGLPARVTGGTGPAVCRVLSPDSRSCEAPSSPSSSSHANRRALPSGQRSGGPSHEKPSAGPDQNLVSSFFHGLFHGLTTGDAGHAGTFASLLSGAGGILKGAAGAIADAGRDTLQFGRELLTDPAGALSRLWNGFLSQVKADQAPYIAKEVREWHDGHYAAALLSAGEAVIVAQQNTTGLGSLYHTVVDDKALRLWNSGNKAEAAGRVLTNLLLAVTPGGTGGKVAKLLGLARGIENVARISKVASVARDTERTAHDAEKAAKNGDLVGAKKAADAARRKAENAKKIARAAGCGAVALGPPVIHIGGRAAATIAAEANPEDCTKATEAEKAAADAARKVQRGAVDPAHVRYTQSSIKDTFGNGKSVEQLIRDLKSGKVKASNVPPLTVTIRNGKIYSFDNRRLYAFKQAGVKVRYKIISGKAEEHQWKRKYSTKTDGTKIRVKKSSQP